MVKQFKTGNIRTSNKYALAAAVGTVTVSIGSFLFEYLPHSFFLEKYKRIFQVHKLQEPAPLAPELQNLFEEVLDDLKMPEIKRKKYEAFPVTGFHLFNAGVNSGIFDAKIGIPQHFTNKSIFDIDITKVRLGFERQPLNMYHPAADALLDSLVLSKEACKFGIAREVLMSQKHLVVYRSLDNAFMILGTFFAADLAREKLEVVNKSPGLTFLVYGASALLGFAMWFQIRDNLTTYFEKSVDKELAQLGKDYVEGGKEFYEKLCKRNMALRILLGQQGTKIWNKDGDELFLIRRKTTPVSHRKKLFDELTIQTSNQEAL